MDRPNRLLEREKNKKYREELTAQIAAFLEKHPDALKGTQEKYGIEE